MPVKQVSYSCDLGNKVVKLEWTVFEKKGGRGNQLLFQDASSKICRDSVISNCTHVECEYHTKRVIK